MCNRPHTTNIIMIQTSFRHTPPLFAMIKARWLKDLILWPATMVNGDNRAKWLKQFHGQILVKPFWSQSTDMLCDKWGDTQKVYVCCKGILSAKSNYFKIKWKKNWHRISNILTSHIIELLSLEPTDACVIL